MFEELKLGIKQDVETFNSGMEDNPLRTIRIAANAKEIKVFPSDEFSTGPSVLFSLAGNVINVSDGDTNKSRFDIFITLNDDGECKFLVEGDERDSWQVRRKALEGIFFKA